MKKESSTNSRRCLGQKNLDTSSFEIPEISLAQLILEQFTVNKETYKILLDIIYGDEGRENGISTITLDRIGDIIGPGYKPGEDKNKNQIRVGQVEEATVIKKQTNKKA